MSNKMITSLTAEQEARLPEFRDKWFAIGMKTGKVNKTKAKAAVRKLYKCANLKPPAEIVFVRSPKEAVQQYQNDSGRKDVPTFCFGNQEVWLSFYNYFMEVCDVDLPQLEGLLACAQECGWLLTFEGIAYVSDRPKEIHVDAEGRLHNETGPAVRYSDGYEVYAWHGVSVPKEIPLGQFSAKDIDDERNAELRRIRLEKFTEARYVVEGGGEILQSDDAGILYRKAINGEPEPMVMVRVVNSTPEPDGEFRTYWLRVPPATKTAREGVAWTFGLTEKQYQPMIET